MQIKLQRLQGPSQTNGDNVKRDKCQTRETFRNKNRECLKKEINELATNRTKISETYIEA
jgi:hypothetical protein